MLIAGQKQKLALFRRNSSEFSPLFRLLEDMFLDDCLYCRFRYLEGQTNQLDKDALSVETISETWFSRNNYSMNEFSNSSGWPTIGFSTCLNSRWNVIAHRCCVILSTSWTPREFFFLGKYRTQTSTKQPLQPACNIVRLQSVHNDPDPTFPVTENFKRRRRWTLSTQLI